MAIKDCTKKNLVGKPVIVEWIDSMSSSGWHDHRVTDMGCTTVGHYHSEYDDRIVVALNRSSCGCGDYMEIPKVAIKKVRRLK